MWDSKFPCVVIAENEVLVRMLKGQAQNAGRLLTGTVRFARTHLFVRASEILFLAFSVLAGDYGIWVLCIMAFYKWISRIKRLNIWIYYH